MGCCLSTSQNMADLSSISTTNPSQWNQEQIILWLTNTSNGHLIPLIKPFKQHRIVGVAFVTITQQELKTELKINEYGLIKTFLMERDKLINDYKQLRMDTLSTTQSNTNSKLPNTPSSSTRKLPHCLMNQIHGNSINNDDKQNHKDLKLKSKSKSKSLQELNDERETSPLLIDGALPITNNLSNHTNHTLHTNTTTTYTEITTNEILFEDENENENENDCNESDENYVTTNDELEDEMDDFNAVITDDDCYIEPLYPPRFSIHTQHTQHSQGNISEYSNYGQQMLARVDRDAWKNVHNDQSVTIDDLKWRKIQRVKSNDSLDVLGINSSNSIKNNSNVYDYQFLIQFSDVSYIGGSKLLISGICHNLLSLIGYESNYNYPHCLIYSIIHNYYYEHEKHLFQFGWDIWKILYKVNKSNLVENESIKSFVGNDMVIETRKKYWKKYRFCSTMDHFNDLLKYDYIQLIARREGTQKILNPNNNLIFMNNNKYLYIYNLSKKREFKKVYNFFNNMLDRKSWNVGTEIEIYSSSLGDWIQGEIIKISKNRQSIVVSYDGSNIGSKYMLKTVNINDIDLVRSTQQFIRERNKWNIGSKIEIYSNGDNIWCPAVIEAIIPKDNKNNVIDTFRVKYKKRSDGLYYTKRIDQWSWQCRNTQNITNKKLKRYKYVQKCQVWNNHNHEWEMYHIIDIIPKHEYLLVRKCNDIHSNEKFIDFNSESIRLIKS